MTAPALRLSSAPSPGAAVLVLAARTGSDDVAVLSSSARDGLADELAAVGFSGGKDELVRLPGAAGGPGLAVVGLPEPVDEDALRYAAGTAIRQLAGVGHVAVELPAADDAQLGAVLEGAALGAYAFTEYRSASRAGVKSPVETIDVIGSSAADAGDALVARALAVSGAASLVKDLVNTPPIDLYPASFAARVEEAAEGLPVTIQVWDEGRLAAERLRRHPRRRAGLDPPAAAGEGGLRAGGCGPAPRARRQGHHVRLGRPLAEARGLAWSA